MRRDKPDGNAPDVYENLEREGWMVLRIQSAVQRVKGVPDAIISRRHDVQHRNHLLELKVPGRHLSAAQVEFASAWAGCVHWAHTSFEANLLLRECEGRRPVTPLRDADTP